MILRSTSFLVVILLLAANFAPVAARVPVKRYGKIKGRVVDVKNARIVRADVLVLGEGLKWRLATNTEGEFEVSLPTGQYQVSIAADGFRRFVSPQFEIKSGKTQRFNIEMREAKPAGLTPAVSDPLLITF